MRKIFLKFLIVITLIISVSSAQAGKKIELFVQLGHSDDVHSVAFSPDGRFALSGSRDDTMKLWDVQSGKEIRTFSGHSDDVSSVAFSPDGMYALTGNYGFYDADDALMRLWDVESGKEIRTFSNHSSSVSSVVSSVAFSPDGRFALSGGTDSIIPLDESEFALRGCGDRILRLWDVESGKEIRTFSGHSSQVFSAAFSPNGRLALSGCENNTLRLWNIESGKEIRTFSGHSSSVTSVAFSPNGQFALSGSWDDTMKLWDVESGKTIRTFSGHSSNVNSVAFSQNGRFALSGSNDDTLKLWDVQSGKEIRTFRGHSDDVTSVAFCPNGQITLSGSDDDTLKLWNVQSGKEIRTFSGRSDDVTSVAFSPDGQFALSGSWDDTMKLWDVESGKEIRTFSGHSSRVTSVAFSPDGRFALSGSKDETLKLWNIQTGKEMRTFSGHSYVVTSTAFSADGRFALSGSWDNTMKLWDIQNGKEIRTFSGHSGDVNSAAFSPDGRLALSGSGDKTLKLWDIQSGKEIRTFSGHSGKVYSVVFSPDGRFALSGSVDNTMKLWDVQNGKEIRTFRGHSRYITSVVFSPDGHFFLSGSSDNTLKLWDIQSGKEIRTFSGHSDEVSSVAFSPDGRFALSGSGDGTIRLWEITEGKEIAEFVGFTNGEWVVVTPEGYYNSSANGDKWLNVRIGNNVYGIDQYRSTFYNPQVVEAAIRLGDTQKAIAQALGGGKEKITISALQNKEPPFIVIKSPEDGKRVTSTGVELAVYIEDRYHPIKEVRAYVNGRHLSNRGVGGIKASSTAGAATYASSGLKILKGQKALEIKIPIELEAGENLIEVMACNAYSEAKKSIHLYASFNKSKGKEELILPNLWILSIGINNYQDKNLPSLTYAVADAEAIVQIFKSQEGKLFRKVNSLLITDKTPIKPSYENILDNLNYLGRAGHKDVVLLFIAGHGLNDERGDFYFLPSNAAFSRDGGIKRSRAVSWRDLKATLDLPAKKLIFADTCHSEGLSGKKTRGVDNDRFVKELQEANAVIFTSSRGRELSQEDDAWGHGAFTHALVKGLSGKADLIKDNKISMKELDTYVSETVPLLTNGAQHPITHTPDGYVNFPLALID